MALWQQAVMLVTMAWSFILIYTLSGAVTMSLFRIPVMEAKVGYGKSLFEIRIGNYPLRFGFMPLGGSVNFDIEVFGRRSLLARWIILLAPAALLMVIAILLLGMQEGWRHFVSGFTQFFTGAFSPAQVGAPLIRKFFELGTHAWPLPVGVLAAKLAAFNLLPIPTLAGGRALCEAFKLDLATEWFNRVAVILTLLTLPLLIGWSIALLYYFFK